ncbi:hypothetical protein LS684_12045 [Cytobacillus spongiae]|jgi:rubrerythrin|uniref:hypothetical protein n=1 Tax=Cytobacillus spongiae TaxID=2901381 RepID=UPI001F25CCA0|nr:hypothetical protein [Cytobacillus spongiae]UII54411.1 hypothetical protein LS684_12045 [Cytobacillus spongiae]
MKILSSITLILCLLIPLPVEATSKKGAEGALTDTTITLKESFEYAIEAERELSGLYIDISTHFKMEHPFTPIHKDKESHIQQLIPYATKYMIKLPPPTGKVELPSTESKAYMVGIQKEKAQIAMYNKFITNPTIPADVKGIYTILRNKSIRHLSIFQKKQKELNRTDE